MPKVYGYSRPSTAVTDPDELASELQRAGAEEILVERPSARGPRAVPLRRKLLNQLKTGDTLILGSLDRLGTSFEDVVRCFAALVERGVNITILDSGLELNAQNGRPYAELLAVLKSASSALRSETIKHNLAAARAKGGKPAGVKPLLSDDMWPEIQERLKVDAVETIAKDLGVSRQTFWTFRKRMSGGTA